MDRHSWRIAGGRYCKTNHASWPAVGPGRRSPINRRLSGHSVTS